MRNLAAFHSAQAIEKALKAIVQDNGAMNEELRMTHNVPILLVTTEDRVTTIEEVVRKQAAVILSQDKLFTENVFIP